MNTSESFRALRRAKPLATAEAVEAVRARVGGFEMPPPRRSRVLPLAAAASLTLVAAITAATLAGSRGEDATAAVQRAAEVTAASAERSGTAVVRITHGGELWTGSTIRWNGRDLAVTQAGRDRRLLLVVDGMMYGSKPGPGRGWVEMGPPSSVDPGSGTTPAEYLAAAREDVGGATLRRITDGMTAPTTSHRDDGSIVYSGKLAATEIARETGFKEGQAIRVLPFGYVAHDLPARVDVAITVDDVVRKLEATWGSWSYTISYSNLGSTAALVAPRNAEPLRREP